MSIHLKSVVISPQEYLEGEQYSNVKHEYIDGHVYAMVGASSAHNLIAINLVTALHAHLRGSPCRVFMSDMKVHVAAANAFYYPDILVTCDVARGDTYYQASPVLIVEVLSPSTALKDTLEKRVAYQSIASLQEYVLIAQDTQEVSIYRRAEAGWDMDIYATGERATFNSVGAEIALAAIYEDVWR